MKTWMITGTSSGFGKALATQVAKASNTQLIATARNLDDLAYLDQYDHGHIKKVKLDVTDPKAIKQAVNDALAFSSQIDVLVNNAGIGYFATSEEADMKDVKKMFDINVFGLFDMTRAILPIMRNQKSGTIVNITSALALTTLPTMGYYSASKYAVEGFGDALRKEVAGLGIKVLNVEPSGARTNWSGKSSAKVVPKLADYQQFKEMVATTDSGVENAPGNPELIAKTIIDVVNSDKEINHLPLGQYAYQGGLDNLKSLVDEIKGLERIALSTDDL